MLKKSHVADTCTPPRQINKSLSEVSILLEFLRRDRGSEQRLPLVVFFLLDFVSWTLIQESLLRVYTHF